MIMDKKIFWKLIDKVNIISNISNKSEILKNMENELMRYSLNEIVEWENIYDYYKELAKKEIIYAAAVIINVVVSEDGYDYFRAWLISKGHKTYMEALKSPDSLVKINCDSGTAFFELYNYVARYAYLKKAFLENIETEDLYKSCGEWLASKKSFIDIVFNDVGVQYEKYAYQQAKELYNSLYSHIRNKLFKYLIYHEPLSEAKKKEIQTEIEFAPEITNEWEISDIEELMPNLYKKYF